MNYSLQIVSEFGEALTGGLGNVYDIALEYTSVLTLTAQLICGIAAMLYVGSKLWQSWAKGESIDFYSMLRPFVIGLIILFFTGFTKVLDALIVPVEAATQYVRESSAQETQNSYIEYFSKQKELRELKARLDAEKAVEQEKLSVWRTISKNLADLKESVLTVTDSLSDTVFKFLVDIGSIVVEVFSMATVYFYKVYVITAKIVLVLIGPFALALSIFPGFHDNFKKWVAQYINISLYIPICNIIGFVQSMIVTECLYKPGVESVTNLLSQPENAVAAVDGSTTMIQICGMLLGIIAIMLYAHVPTFANWILRGDGSGGLAAAFSVTAGLAATRLGNNESINKLATSLGFKAPEASNAAGSVPPMAGNLGGENNITK